MTHSSAFLVYPHQLFEDIFSTAKDTLCILIEDDLFFRQFPFHKQKLILHRASMQLFKQRLTDEGFAVAYVETSETAKSMDQLSHLLTKHAIKEVTHYELVDDWLEKRLTRVCTAISVQVSRLNSPGFLTTRGQITDFFENHPNRMQHFYEWQRKRLSILVENNKPVGGKWSYDLSNRKKLPKNIQLPAPYTFQPSQQVSDAIKWVEQNFKDNPGKSDSFYYPTTHVEARQRLEAFIAFRLKDFGPYEDAIDSQQSELFHSVLSPLLNSGLLTPDQVIDAVKDISLDTVPIESLEGFIRQIIGWREYMRATYVQFGREMRTSNHLNFTKALPKSWWNGTVGIKPIDTVISRVLETGYAHHIERLMVLGNSMVLLRLKPDDVYEWFMSLFIDAYDWVMVPNVYAMSQFAAGDLITTKPYISGSNYIIKMSDFKKEKWSSVWDALYWQFVTDHRSLLEANYRAAMVVKLYDRMDDTRKAELRSVAKEWL